MFSIKISHWLFQFHHFIAEIKSSFPVNLSWNRCEIHIDYRQFSSVIFVKFSLPWKIYGDVTLNLLVIQKTSTRISDLIHTVYLYCLHVFILWWNLTKITMRIQHSLFVNFLLITSRFNVKFSLYFHSSENFREIAH